SLVLLIVIQVLALFVFENMHALFTSLEKNEVANFIAVSDLQAELHVQRTLLRQSRPGRENYFDHVLPLPRPEMGRQVIAVGRERRLEIKKPLGTAGLLFQKLVRSRQLDSFKAMKKILSNLVIFLGIFLAVSGVYFVVLLRKRPPEKSIGAGSPFQDYLVEMKGVQQELQELVAAKNRSTSEKEELNQSIINTVHLGVLFLNQAGTIEIFNPAAQEMFGRSFASARNRRLEEVLPDHPELVCQILASGKRNSFEIESGGFIFFVDVVPVGDGGSPSPSRGPSGSSGISRTPGEGRQGPLNEGRQGRLALVRDVSADRKREKIMRRNTELMMLGEMAAPLAHEIRNSLGVILGYGKALSGEPEKSRKIAREVQFMTEMMESFLRFARPVSKVSHRKTDLGPLIAAAAAAQEIPVDLPAEGLELKSDPLLLNVVFSNLFLNARQAGAKRLHVEFAPGAAPAVTIADDGPGITAANDEKVWLPFFSTRDKGTGMGLATVKKLVGALGGDIQLLNPGEPGARFRIIFYN
ncbi:MAG TPA: ATP-binding protein, partial [Acidobacteriota bacterium]